MTTKTKKPRPILATYDRQPLTCACFQLLNNSLSDDRSLPSTRFIRQYLPNLEEYEIAEVMALLGKEYGYQRPNQFGKWASDANPLTHSEKAFKWIARQPDKLALLQTAYDILRAYEHSWPLAESILFSGACIFEPYMIKPKIKEAHDYILNTIRRGPATLNLLDEMVGDCRQYILQLRALGHKIHMRPYWNSETGATFTQFYLSE